MHFKINLTLIAVLSIVLFFSIPFYNNWLNTNLLNPSLSFWTLYKQMDIEQRKISRFGYSYVIYKEVAGVFESAKIKNPVLLLPPDAFLKERRVTNLAVVEPAIFYYFTGHKAVWYNSPGVAAANCALVPDNNGKVVLKRITTPEDLNNIITAYKKYKID